MEMEIIFTIANVVFTIGTLRLFKTVIKNRSSLHDFDLVGSLLTSVALFLMVIGYIGNRMTMSLIFIIPTFAFWILVSLYSINSSKKINETAMKQIKMNPKELLEQYLHKINWSLNHHGCDHYTIVDHNGTETEYVLWDTSIICKTDNVVTAFDIKKGNIKLIGFDAVSIGADNSFVLFMNHELSDPVETVEDESARSG